LIYSHAERFVAFLQTAAREKLEQVNVLSAQLHDLEYCLHDCSSVFSLISYANDKYCKLHWGRFSASHWRPIQKFQKKNSDATFHRRHLPFFPSNMLLFVS